MVSGVWREGARCTRHRRRNSLMWVVRCPDLASSGGLPAPSVVTALPRSLAPEPGKEPNSRSRCRERTSRRRSRGKRTYVPEPARPSRSPSVIRRSMALCTTFRPRPYSSASLARDGRRSPTSHSPARIRVPRPSATARYAASRGMRDPSRPAGRSLRRPGRAEISDAGSLRNGTGGSSCCPRSSGCWRTFSGSRRSMPGSSRSVPFADKRQSSRSWSG